MENLKLLRNAKKKSRQLELQKKIQKEQTESRLNATINCFNPNRNYLDCLETNINREGLI